MTHQELAKAMAAVVKDYVRTDRAGLETRIAQLEAKTVAPEIAPEDIAASVAGLLRKELADLDLPPRTTKRIVRDASGAVKYAIEETS
jgi:hypothetical protein